jgi:SAM-dependent methyltransferase
MMQATRGSAARPCCRFCASPLGAPIIDLGRQPLANNNLMPGAEATEQRFPLVVSVCPECLLVQADHGVPADAIFTEDYAYFSSYSKSWVAHAKAYAEAMTRRFGLGKASLVAEVASNDGYLLQHFLGVGIPVLGIEPTRNTAEAAIAKGIVTEIDFFGTATAERLVSQGKSADLIAANNVLAHVPDIRDFVTGFARLLAPEGVATFEFPHLLNMIEKVQFDTIYHEHYSYLSLHAVKTIAEASGLKVFDIERLSTHGGSLRVFVCRAAASHVLTPAVAETLAAEHALGLDDAESAAYRGFSAKAEHARASFLAFLGRAKAEGKTVAGYGAAAKGNTFLNYCGLGADALTMIADASHAKQGKLAPGTHIPIVSPEALTAAKPDYVVILPWNLAEEIAGSMAAIRAQGGRFVIAIPETRVLA